MDAHQHHPQPRAEGPATYPRAAVQWLVGEGQKSVLEIGAGGGGLTDQLVGLGHDVHATDPRSEAVVALAERHPGIRTSTATAEVLPAMDGSVDVVICAQVFDSFAAETALAEIARVLRPGGHVALLSNTLDIKIPWVRKLAAIADPERVEPTAPDALVQSTRFGFVESSTIRHWQTVHRDSLCDVALSLPHLQRLDPGSRDRRLDQVRALYDDYERGPDGMQLPWIAHCHRAAVIEHAWQTPRQEGVNVPAAGQPAAAPRSTQPVQQAAPAPGTPPTDPDDGATLIDFR